MGGVGRQLGTQGRKMKKMNQLGQVEGAQLHITILSAFSVLMTVVVILLSGSGLDMMTECQVVGLVWWMGKWRGDRE